MAVGRIIEGLKATGQWENTIIVFTSDHGDFLGDHGRLRKGTTPSDMLLHIPFILRAPGGNLPDRVDTPMSNVDVLPTLAALADVTPPDWCHGADMGQVLRDKKHHVALAFCTNGLPEMMNYTLYDDTYRFSIYPHTGYVELFDHHTDPGECHNLAEQHDQQLRIAAFTSAIQARLMQYYAPILGRVSAW
jgi:arylsulfatase A-like enzyme